MTSFLVSGLVNIEVNLAVESFPVSYTPVRYPFFGVNIGVAGVGINVGCGLSVLGNEVRLLALLGQDALGELSKNEISRLGFNLDGVLRILPTTPSSVVLFDQKGKRQIHLDLKDIQERAYPRETFLSLAAGIDAFCLCNVNFSRELLPLARARGGLVATDVHVLSDLDDPYNKDFMEKSQIVFMSDEALPCPPEEWAKEFLAKYPAEVLVIGLGPKGACLATREGIETIPAIPTRPVVNTIGAGDALFSCFLHYFIKDRDARASLRKACCFASWKIGESGATQGLLKESGLQKVWETYAQSFSR